MTTWFITGINSGLGRQMTQHLLARGDSVAGTVRKAGSVDDLKATYGDRLWVGNLDVTDLIAVRRVIDAAFSALGHIHVIVNNAGYGLLGAAEELSDEQIRHQIDTNLIGSMQVVRAALPHLRAQGGGRIIQISTMGGQATFAAGVLYHTSQWAIEGFIDALRYEVAAFGIGVTIIEPGSAQTDFAGALQFSAPMEAYAAGPVGQTRAYFANASTAMPGDPKKMARAIIDSATITPAPLRLALGTDAYQAIHRALTERLAELEAHKAITLSTDF
jgi:NAD(P)-dependent dehydrogenase (short-subunit alcohol dehydrogenase family)